MIDSCLHLKKKDFRHIKYISNKIKSHKIKKAFCYFDYQTTNKDREIFFENCSKFNNVIPVTFLKKRKNMNEEINSIIKKNYKFVKIHPRFLNIRLSNQKFYLKTFRLLAKTNLKIIWCTFDGWEKTANEINQLDFLANLIKLIPKKKIILMHGGGPNLLKYYEKFRFINNVFLDLSYTLIHFKNTSLEKDMIFLTNNFDKRIIFGSDYPCFSLKEYIRCFQRLIKNSKINKKKIYNLKYGNLENIIND